MKFGLSNEQYDFLLRSVVLPLEELGAKIWVYGSRARGTNQKFSDIDLMVESNADLTKEISNISESLSEGNFPYKVDLVAFAQFADSYKPQYLKDRISFR